MPCPVKVPASDDKIFEITAVAAFTGYHDSRIFDCRSSNNHFACKFFEVGNGKDDKYNWSYEHGRSTSWSLSQFKRLQKTI